MESGDKPDTLVIDNISCNMIKYTSIIYMSTSSRRRRESGRLEPPGIIARRIRSPLWSQQDLRLSMAPQKVISQN